MRRHIFRGHLFGGRGIAAALIALVVLTACSRGSSEPEVSDEAIADADLVVRQVANRIYDPLNGVDPAPIERLGAQDDERMAWIVADALRFVGRGPEHDALIAAGESLSGLDLEPTTAWLRLNNHLLETDVPAPPGYREWKGEMFEAIDVTWSRFFSDENADIDWRQITFGGVKADRRTFGSDESCLCIASLDEPPSVSAEEGSWYPDNEVVFGVVVNGEARAYPRNIMTTHEMVNDTLGGRRLGIPYCTLCKSAHAYFLDDLPEPFNGPALRTSGLLRRSNKVSFDLETLSMVDTFTGRPLSGAWLEAGVELTAVPIVTSTWEAWREAHPGTTIMAGKDGTGADYPLEAFAAFADNGLRFPVGDIDGSLFPETPVIGVTTDDGSTFAFVSDAARAELRNGGSVGQAGISLELDGTGVRAFDTDGNELVANEASWFAWSQFNPSTELWTET